jgi:probable phosphoglycerate mutase
MPGELWLMRHGETEWSRSGQHTSRTDLPLTPEGEKRAEDLKRALNGRKFARVLSSPMRRALDTCRLAGYTPTLVTEDLREWDYGSYEGLTTEQIQKTSPGWTIWNGTPEGGETIAQVGARADRAIAEAVGAAAGDDSGDAAIFAHGHLLRVLAARWLKIDPDAGRFFSLDTGSISVLGWERDTRVIRIWNVTRV